MGTAVSYNRHCSRFQFVAWSAGLDASELKREFVKEVEAHRDRLTQLSLKIHKNPETAFKEEQAASWLIDYLGESGFAVEKGICGLTTAFRARYGKGKPVVALLAEYDALPKLGHACGHNIIATSAVGAGVAARLAVDRLEGTVQVMGTPGEEIGGGKVIMVKKGAFEGVDAVMMVHPAGLNTAATKFLACQSLEVEFFGKPAHAAARPEAGVNALEALLLSYAGINSLRQHIKNGARIHGIITDGGEAANIVPTHTAAHFIVRAEDDAYLDELKERVINCFKAGALATGARLDYRWAEVRYAPLLNNLTLARLFRANLQALGRRVHLIDPRIGIGSSDIGNVSQVVPSIHPLIAIASPSVVTHSPLFAARAVSDAGSKGLLDAAKALAMTVADLLENPLLVAKAKEEFKQRKGR
jgi:amidohydrolase